MQEDEMNAILKARQIVSQV